MNNEKKLKILLSGRLDLGPLARHLRAFLETLSTNKNNLIYIDPFMIEHYRCDDFGTNDLLNQYLQIDNVKLADKHTEYDFSIFTDLLTLNYGDTFYKHFFKYKSKIKICYEVFDGSIPPLDWIDMINNNFDICCSPSVYIADCLKKAGVTIPCFNLPCVVFNDELLAKQPKLSNKKIRFGFIGGAEQRKNPQKVIDAFYKAFKGNNDVELYIHSAYSPEPEYVQGCFDRLNKYKKDCNITFTFEKRLSKDEMYDLISTFSFYVFPTKTTGYFTTPCEALSVGIPIIVSDIPVHQELVQNLDESDGAFLIEAKETDIMIHSYLGNKFLGAQHDMSVDAIAKQLKKAYDNFDILFTQDKIEKRKDTARAYSLKALTPLFETLINPKEIVISKNQGIKDNTLFIDNETLLNKYKDINNDIKIGSDKKLSTFKYYIQNEPSVNLIEKICIECEKTKLALSKENSELLNSKLMQKMLTKGVSANVNHIPRIIYEQFSVYCRFKRFFNKIFKSNKKN